MRLVIFGVFIQTGGICLQKRRHLVDKGTGTAGTDTVHTLLHISAFKIDDLCVLAAELDGYVRLGSVVLQGCGYGDNLLDKGNAQMFGQGQTAASGDHRMRLDGSPSFVESSFQEESESVSWMLAKCRS